MIQAKKSPTTVQREQRHNHRLPTALLSTISTKTGAKIDSDGQINAVRDVIWPPRQQPGKVAVVSCHEGFTTDQFESGGNDRARLATRVCRVDGTWDGEEPTCKRENVL
jgi:hypothetical protein